MVPRVVSKFLCTSALCTLCLPLTASHAVVAMLHDASGNSLAAPTASACKSGAVLLRVTPGQLNTVRSADDKRWDELFASTTEDEFARLRAILHEENDAEDVPLDLVIK